MLFPARPRGAGPRTASSSTTPPRGSRGAAGPATSRRSAARRRSPARPPRPGHAAARRARARPASPVRTCAATGCVRGGAGRAWTTRFRPDRLEVVDDRLVLDGRPTRPPGSALVLELESLVGGALRGRWTLTNTGHGAVRRGGAGGRAAGRRPPRRDPRLHRPPRARAHPAAARRSPTGSGCARAAAAVPASTRPTMVVVGTPGFSHHARRGGRRPRRLERQHACCGSSATPATGTTLGGGELLLPGEVVLGRRARATPRPWVYVAAADDGLDGLAAAWHALPAVARRAPGAASRWCSTSGRRSSSTTTSTGCAASPTGRARVGRGAVRARRRLVPRPARRHRRPRRLVVDESVWPDGLDAADRPRARAGHGVRAVVRAGDGQPRLRPASATHPDWILSAGAAGRRCEHRSQQVLDLTRPEVFDHLFERVHRDPRGAPDRLREVGPQPRPARGGHAAARRRAGRARADRWRSTGCSTGCAAAHPDVAWESCASGGGRIDLGVLERVQRVWTSDMTDALARQQIQRWTTQLVAPEYVGAHVSSPTSHTTGRTLALDFRVRDGAVRRVRHRVGPHRGLRAGPRPARRLGRALPGASGRCCTPAASSGRSRRPGRAAARGRRGRPLARRCVAHVRSTRAPTTAGSPCGCPGSIPTRRTGWPGRVRSPQRRSACRRRCRASARRAARR